MVTLSIEGWTGSARFSDCQTYRYELSREWPDGEGTVLFVMLNPSTASADANDPTIRRCMGFARAWGHRRLEICNLFAYRATDPKDMDAAARAMVNIIGPGNNDAIYLAASRASKLIVAWGAHRRAVSRGKVVMRLLYPRHAFSLGLTSNGAPRHPLYVPANFAPVEYRSPL